MSATDNCNIFQTLLESRVRELWREEDTDGLINQTLVILKCRNSSQWGKRMRESTTAEPRTTQATQSARLSSWKSVSVLQQRIRRVSPDVAALHARSLSFHSHRRHWRGWDCAGRASGGRGAPVHNSRDLLRLQERLLLQSETDRKQVKHPSLFLTIILILHFHAIPDTKLDFLSLSYKVPAKGDGVDYVRTEDEVSTNKISQDACIE